MLSLIPVEGMQRLLRLFLVLTLLGFLPVSIRAEPNLGCDLPEDLVTPTDPLTYVSAAVARGNLNILAIGSGSTVGDSGGSNGPALNFHAPRMSFPFRMVSALEALRPSVHFELTVKGGRSMTAESMLAILQQELAARHYDLVLWQTGTVEAVHGLRPDTLRTVLQDGADAAANTKTDIILIDPQFSRFLRANTDLAPYQTVMQQMTGNPGVTLFHRFDLTQTWAGNGEIDVERASREQRDKTIAQLNTCLGQALARYILGGAAQHQ